MRPRTVALLGLAIAGIAVLWWLRFATDPTRREAEMSAAALREDILPHHGGRVADDRAASSRASHSPAVARAGATVASAVSPVPDAAVPRRTGVAGIVAEPIRAAGDLRMLTAEEILRAMRESYARLGSYTDQGRLTRTWHEAGRVYVDVPFRTFFKRPLLYRFEWLGGSDPYQESYWANSAGFRVRRANGAWSRHVSFAHIFPYPESATAPHHVLQFLAPQATRADARFLLEATRLEDETMDGVLCFHLSGTATWKRIERHLWIGHDDFLLRRIRSVGPYAYNVSATPRYGSGTETVQVDYLDVTTDLSLPDELF